MIIIVVTSILTILIVTGSFYLGLRLGLQSVRLQGETPKFSEPRILPPKKNKPSISTPDIKEISKKQQDAKMDIPTIVRRRDGN